MMTLFYIWRISRYFYNREMKLFFSLLQKPRYDNAGVEVQLPPPPSPPQLKEAAQLDGVPRPNSVDRILHSDGIQHIGHEALNKVRILKCRKY